MNDTLETIDHALDGSAVLVGAASFFEFLPSLAALFTILWLGVRLWEHITGEPFHHSLLAKLIVKLTPCTDKRKIQGK